MISKGIIVVILLCVIILWFDKTRNILPQQPQPQPPEPPPPPPPPPTMSPQSRLRKTINTQSKKGYNYLHNIGRFIPVDLYESINDATYRLTEESTNVLYEKVKS